MKKNAVIICSVMMLACFSTLTVLATDSVAVKIRVEGISNTIVATGEGYTTQATTVLDALIELLENENILNTITNGQYGKEIVTIDGQTKAHFGGYDGWMYLVNETMPINSIENCPINNNDEIVVFYGEYPPGTLIPQITVSDKIYAGGQFTVDLQSTYCEYLPPDWNPVIKTVKISGAKVTFNGVDYVTGEDGKATVTAPGVVGDYVLSISKQVEGSLPAIVRNTVKVKVLKPVEVDASSLTCAVPVKNNTSSTITARLILGVYKDGVLVAVGYSQVEQGVIAAGESVVLNATANVQMSAGYYTRVFVVRDLENMEPLTD